ncbi:MAG: transcription termination factor Rho [Synergistaceae bacterium]|jgi:transcription termination factor Rho|nr:transcription termination factor Rho [Synergistaceae bacterium]
MVVVKEAKDGQATSRRRTRVAPDAVVATETPVTRRRTTVKTSQRAEEEETPAKELQNEQRQAEAGQTTEPKRRGRRPRVVTESPLLPLPELEMASTPAEPVVEKEGATTAEPGNVPERAAAPSEPVPEITPPSPAVAVTETVPAAEAYVPPKPKHSYGYLASQTLVDLRKIGKELNVPGATTLRKDDLIISVLKAQAESMNYRFGGGTLEILPEGFGFLRPKGMLPTDNDVYLSVSQIRRFGLRNGDVIWGLIRPPREQEHYEALLRVETVNFSDPEHSRRRAQFGQLTPIFPNVRMSLETGQKELATRLVDMFAPIGMGQRALIVSPPKAGKTTLLKRIANSISINCPDVILMALLIDERPEEVTDIARSVDGEVIASTFDRPADEHIRVANLALEKAKRLAEAKRDVVILLDSITRLARASNLTVPPSGRTLSGGLDPSGLYFPKRFFGAARNFEDGGSLTIVGTALTDTGSRMDDVIYEEFKGTGNMELHLSRKLAEQRIFPAIDITRSGTRREELLIPEDELARLWVLRKRIVGVDEAGALNLILDKLRQTQNNREFLMSIKLP